MKVVCQRGDVVAEIVSSPDGPTIVVPHVAVFDTDDGASRGYSPGTGERSERLLTDDPIYGNDGLTAACRKCELEFHLIPHDIQRHYKAGVERLAVKPRKATHR